MQNQLTTDEEAQDRVLFSTLTIISTLWLEGLGITVLLADQKTSSLSIKVFGLYMTKRAQ